MSQQSSPSTLQSNRLSRRQTEEATYDHLLKLVLVGDSSVGKSNLLARFTGHDFDDQRKSTIGVEFASKIISVDGQANVKAQIWDTAGQERYRAIANSYYRGAVGVLLVYDICNRRTFSNLPRWIDELRRHADSDIIVVLVGNKCDLPDDRRAVEREEAERFAKANSVILAPDTSAKTGGTTVSDVFELLIGRVYHRLKEKGALDVAAAPMNSIAEFQANRQSSIRVKNTSPPSSSQCC